MKTRKIILHKDQILYDVEGMAYKFAEANALEGKAKNTLAADHNETLDGRLLSRMMDVRDARLKKRLRFALAPVNRDVSCDNPGEEQEYVYSLSLADGFDDNMLDVVKVQMHEYIVRGALLDWYKRLGMQTAAVDPIEVADLEENIVSSLRTPSYTRVPLQPFGPRK